MDPIIWIFAAVLGLLGLGSVEVQEDAATPSATSSAAAEPRPADTPATTPPPWVTVPRAPLAVRFAERPAYPSCGQVELDRTGRTTPDLVDGWSCLVDALVDGQTAELRTTFLTVEGDPIREYHRITPGGRYEYYADNREDAFRGKDLDHRTCPPPADFGQRLPPEPVC